MFPISLFFAVTNAVVGYLWTLKPHIKCMAINAIFILLFELPIKLPIRFIKIYASSLRIVRIVVEGIKLAQLTQD